MKAILCTAPGTPDDLHYADLPDPVAGAGEAVVRVEAAALNFFDTLIIANKYQVKPALPFSPGAEFAGVIESIHDENHDLRPGDRVVGFIGYGAARERLAVKTSQLIKLPDRLDAMRAAGLSVTYGTTYYALKNRAQLKRNETLAVLGAAGGTGLAAVEIGKIMGARVIACASSPEKLQFARSHGADALIDYGSEDLKQRLKELTDGKGVDVIYDPVGGDLTQSALRAIAWDGRLLVIGFAGGDIPNLPLNLVLLKNCSVIGVLWGAWVQRDPHGHQDNTRNLLRWAEDGKISAHVHAIYPLAQAAQALKDIAARKAMGKVLLKP